MDHEHMLAAVTFGAAMLVGGQEVEPIFTGTRPSDDHRLMISPRQLRSEDPHEKDVVTSVVAGAMRAWGATEIMFLADAYVIKTNDPAEAAILPSENPKYVDALIVNVYRADGEDEGIFVTHHLDDQGKVEFGPAEIQPAPPPESESPAITDQGRFPRVMHSALQMTDEQVRFMLEEWPGGGRTLEQMFEKMRSEGYVVLEGDENGLEV